jgi:Cell division protein CrgA
VPPPKRKSGGRVTPAGTKPGSSAAATARTASERATTVGASSRYTPPVPQSAKESPPWVPVLMLVLFAVGALAIMLRYLVFSDSNLPMVVGLACLLGGLYTATKWR